VNLNRSFSPPEQSARTPTLLPFRFLPLDERRYAAVNAGGEHIVTDRPAIQALVDGCLPPDHPQTDDFEARHFIARENTAVGLLASHIRTRLSRLPDFTGLHMFVVTLRCDHSCQYCQVSRVSEDRAAFDMTPEIADAALAHVFKSPSPHIKIEFQGGETLLNFELIKYIIEKAMVLGTDRDVQFVIATNLGFIDDDIINYCRNKAVFFSVSLDGPAFLHNANRPRPGNDSHARAKSAILRVRQALGPERISALMTTTQLSLAHPEEIVDEYVSLGFDTIFLRHLSDYGFAARSRGRIGYQANAFVEFFKKALTRVIEWNQKGTRIVESYTHLLLRRLLTSYPTGYVDLQSPSGMGIGALLYNYNGKVYTADEGRMLAEMGDDTFCIGHVNDDYKKLITGSNLVPMLRESMVEAVPMCSDCAFNMYCGTDPLYHYRAQGNWIGHRPTSEFCFRNMEIIKHLVCLLEDDREARQVLMSWMP